MDLRSFLEKYSQGKSISLLCETVNKQHNQLISVSGVHGSTYATIAAALYEKKSAPSFIMCILNDEDEAGYFYQDLKALLKNSSDVMFYPSSYRLRGGKYIKDEENGILRTEALGKILAGNEPFLLVSYPEAVAEKVSDKKKLAGNYEKISAGDAIDISELNFVNSSFFSSLPVLNLSGVSVVTTLNANKSLKSISEILLKTSS